MSQASEFRGGVRALNSLATTRMRRDIDPEVLELFAAARPGHFQHKFVGTIKFGRPAIERDERRHLGRQALLDIGGLQRAARGWLRGTAVAAEPAVETEQAIAA